MRADRSSESIDDRAGGVAGSHIPAHGSEGDDGKNDDTGAVTQ